MSDWKALRLCDAASDWLAEQYPDALIIRELSIGNYGSALLDIAAITENEIIGIEIKGDGDSAARLERQGWIYSRVATRMGLLPAPSLEAAAYKHLPQGWTLLRLSGGLLTHRIRGGDFRPLPNAPAALLETLWGKEMRQMADEFCLTKPRYVHELTEMLAENVPLRLLRPAVCRALRKRDWLAVDAEMGKVRPARYRWADGRPLKVAA